MTAMDETTGFTRTVTANVLVIGTGGAGLRAAIAAHEARRVGHRPRQAAARRRAHGARVRRHQRRTRNARSRGHWQQHFVDTLREGYFLGDPRVVEMVAREAPAAVEELAEWGCGFARTDDGDLDQRFFGAHRWRRTCYAGDYSGRAILQTLVAKVQSLGIPVVEDQYVSRLLVADGACFGAFTFDLHDGARTAFVADAVVLVRWRRTRACGAAARRGATRTSARGCASRLQAGCR